MTPRFGEELELALDRSAFARAVGLVPDRWQEDLLRSDSKRVLLNVSRQAGKSTMAAILALHRVLHHPRSLVLCLAPALRQSQELFAKIGQFYGALGEPLKAYGERRLSLELTNHSRIITLPGREKTIRGYSGASLLIVDEAARVDDALYFSVRPMLAVSGGSLLMLSTPWGKRGVFFEEWMNGQGWERFEVTAHDCPRISREFLEEEAKALGPRWFRQEYECSFEEGEDQLFRNDLIERAFVDTPGLWADFAVDGVAQYHYDANVEQWRSAEDLMLGRRPRRTLAEIETDINRYLAGAPGFDPERLIREYEDVRNEEEASGRGR